MKVTTRQKEFLEVLIDLYQQKGSSVHYSEVALKMGVSKWTAYDMLQLLRREGLLEVELKRDTPSPIFPKETFPQKYTSLIN
jgi:Mn-dependent DtxR family transcriptional regulator